MKAPGGGYVLASSKSIHPAVNPRNYKAMPESLKKFGRYPLDEEMTELYKTKDFFAKYRN